MNFVNKLKKFLVTLKLFLIFLLGSIFVVLLFPREGKFRYEFQKGKPWLHQVLIAPFNFPIYKTDAILKSERDSVLKKFVPYFRLDSTIEPTIIEKFNKKFEASWLVYLSNNNSTYKLRSSVKNSYYEEIKSSLNQIYSKGILHLQPENILTNNSINLISGKLAESRLSSNVYTQKTAYEFLKSETDNLGARLEPRRNPTARFTESFELSDLVEPNLFYDSELSGKMKQALVDEISTSQGMVQSGEKIIALGELVNDNNFQILQSLKREYETNFGISRNYSIILLGQIILVSVTFLILYLFLLNFAKDIIIHPNRVFFIIMLIMLITTLSALTIYNERISLYVVPVVIIPIILKTFFNTRIAIFVHGFIILLIGFWAPNGFEFVLMNFIAGVIAISPLSDMYRRGNLFISSVLAFFAYSIIYTGMGLIQEGRVESLNLVNYAWFGGNALLIMTAYPLIYIFEKIFGFLSDATLIELADINQPMLRKLAEQAPGTFQHSLQVANLAEECALKVGVNPLLIRTAALYHDIGKLEDPLYYIENQTTHFNPHDKLSFEESAKKIISHVTRGIEFGKKIKLPSQLIDFIPTHHGTTTVQYFYKSFLKKYPELEIDTQQFTYPGPKPFSKETAILMMADSIEATSRSMKIIDTETISEMVEEIIKRQFDEKQFDDVDLTFKDIEVLKQVFKGKLLNIYHARIEYPK